MQLTTLLESKATETAYHQFLANVRWPDHVICPYCRSEKTYKRKTSHGHKCRSCNCSFTATTCTLFHATKIPLRKWFMAIHLVTNAVKGISSLQLARTLGVNKNTAWYMQYRIREGMKSKEITALLNNGRSKPQQAAKKSRRHRNKIRPHIQVPKRQSAREQFHTKAPSKSRHRQLFNRAIQGQYHRLSDFHLRSYEQEVHYKKICYKQWMHLSLLSRMCAFM